MARSSFDGELIEFIDCVVSSYCRYTHKILVDGSLDLIGHLYDAPFVFAAHKYYADEPRFVFGNTKALELWELDWDSFVGMPSRLTAEAPHQDERERLLREVQMNGFIDNYTGVRVSSRGKRFQINNAIVWNVLDPSGSVIGQAVKFDDYQYLES